MKIFTCPTQVPPPKPDYSNYNHEKAMLAEKDHENRLREWLKANGYPGKHTGLIYSVGVADGSADYMIADGRTFCLIHLPYGDAYQSRDVQFIPKKEIIRRAYASQELNKLFAAKTAI